jgi:hypothetical protein
MRRSRGMFGRSAHACAGILVLTAAPLALAETASSTAEPPNNASLWQALRASDLRYSLRYRWEDVAEGGAGLDATASTVRARVAARSAAWQRLSLAAEIDHVTRVGGDGYNSTRNGRTDRALVADPQGTELNVLALQFTGVNHVGTLGRQRLNFDDERLVGGVAWRQNEQTFDAFSWRWRVGRVDATYAFVANVNRIFGPSDGSPSADLRGVSHLVNAQWDTGKLGGVALFAYRLDFDNAAPLSSQTVGVRWSKAFAIGNGWRLAAQGSFAVQEDSGDNPIDFQANYSKAEAALKRGDWALTLGREWLGGSLEGPGRSFQTPLATVHLFQGWADRFTTTPPAGVEDVYAGVSGALGPVKLAAAWHEFSAARGAQRYGTEWDAQASWSPHPRVDLLAKIADYSASGFSTDSRKLWLQALVTF